jgi:putative transcriptional regulator
MENNITPGTLLISDPFLKDPNFVRTTVLICDDQTEGSFGFVLNKKKEEVLGDLIEDLEGNTFPVYFGGPVQTNTLHFLHQCPQLITGGIEVLKGIYWGGDFADVITLLLRQELSTHQIRFFLGYSGWGVAQLQQEIDDKSWILSQGSKRLLFNTSPENSWKSALQELGGEYQMMVNYPLDPQLN